MGSMERLNPQARKTTQAVPVAALDSLGRSLVEGDVVLLKDTAGMLWNVTGVHAEVDPRQPPNLVRVELVARRALRVRAGSIVDLVRVRSAEEAGTPAAEQEFFPPRRRWWQRALGIGQG
jgi:hypothetical protein